MFVVEGTQAIIELIDYFIIFSKTFPVERSYLEIQSKTILGKGLF